MALSRLLVVLTVIFAVVACGPAMTSGDRPAADDASSLHFVTFGAGVSGLVAKAKKSEIKICLSGVIGGEEARWERDIKTAAQTWLAPLRRFTKDKVAESVSVVRGASGGCDGAVIVHRQVHAHARVGSIPQINMAASGYFGSYGILLHEFGHAFGLGDTYVRGGASGQCQQGQPQSVMCNVSFRELQDDDIKGLFTVFKRTFPSDTPPDADRGTRPPPAVEPLNTRIHLALPRASSDEMRLFFAAEEASADGRASGQLLYCLGDALSCKAPGAKWHPAARTKEQDGVVYFRSSAPRVLREGMSVTTLFKVQQREKLQEVSLVRR